MKSKNSQSRIAEFYSQYPFPNIYFKKKSDIYETLIYKLINGLVKKYFKTKKGRIKILDAGCGTGELALGFSEEGREILAVDVNGSSIEIAKKNAARFKIKEVTFKVLDFVKSDLPKKYFDFIFSIGVLHHTAEPEKNFSKLVKSLKKGGYITIGIYNPYGSLRVRIKRGILRLLAGDNFEKKIEIYRKIFYRRKLSVMEEVAVADAFANPYRRYYSFEQLIKWFEKNNIEYLDSAPSIELSKNIKLISMVIKNIIRGENMSLMSVWQDIMYKHGPTRKWEISKPISLLTQLSWAIIGRGELINIVGRKK